MKKKYNEPSHLIHFLLMWTVCGKSKELKCSTPYFKIKIPLPRILEKVMHVVMERRFNRETGNSATYRWYELSQSP
jgi:hypothetical protein